MSLLVGLIFVGIPHFLPPWISNFFWSLIPWSKFPHMCLKVWRRALGNWPNTMVENLKLNCSAIAYQQCFYNSNDHCSCRIFYCYFPLAFANHTSVYGLSWHFFHISLKNSELTTLRDCRVLFFDNLSRNSCIQLCSLYVGSAKREPFVIMHNVVVPLLGPELNVFSPSEVVVVPLQKI